MKIFSAATNKKHQPTAAHECPRSETSTCRRSPQSPGAGPERLARRRVGLSGLFALLMGFGVMAGVAPEARASWWEPQTLSLRMLESQPKMTPRKFANYFEGFKYELRRFLQQPDDFLSRRAGDCDDYAVLAAQVLSRYGYHTRVVYVSMQGLNVRHAVCYVDDDGVYLDYNNRNYLFNVTHCGPQPDEIARQVAASFDRQWARVSQSSYAQGDLVHDERLAMVNEQIPHSANTLSVIAFVGAQTAD